MPRRRLPIRWLAPTAGAVLDLLYPPTCVGCQARLADARAPLCPRCLAGLERADPAETSALVARLPEAEAALAGTFALWLFDAGGAVQRLQHRLKYGNRPRLGLPLGHLIGHGYRAAGLPVPDLVVPIPLHRLRRYDRGYNQSTFLARGAADALGADTREDALTRPRATRSQTRLSRQRRWKNVEGAFAVTAPEAVAGRHLLLIDDVLTTGATLAAAGAALRTAGAATVHAATLALAR